MGVRGLGAAGAGYGGFDAGVDLGLGELGGDADAVEDGFFVGRPMAYDADAADAEEGGAAVLGVVEALLPGLEGLLGEESADLRSDGGAQVFAEGGADEFGQAFAGLEGDVADEAVADDDVGAAIEEVAAFDVADDVEAGGAKKGEGFPGLGVALGVFFADGEQADAGVGDVEDAAGVEVAHDGELEEVCGVGVDVGADIEEDGWVAVGGGKDGSEGGAVDAGEHAEDHLCGGHGGAGVAGGKEAGGAAFADHFEADAHGGVAFGADGLGCLVVHADPLGGVDDLDGEDLATELGIEQWTEAIAGADEVDADVELTARSDGPANLGFGGLVGAHPVYGDVSRHLGVFLGL